MDAFEVARCRSLPEDESGDEPDRLPGGSLGMLSRDLMSHTYSLHRTELLLNQLRNCSGTASGIWRDPAVLSASKDGLVEGGGCAVGAVLRKSAQSNIEPMRRLSIVPKEGEGEMADHSEQTWRGKGGHLLSFLRQKVAMGRCPVTSVVGGVGGMPV